MRLGEHADGRGAGRQGLSPGAALVFLLSGPATNATAIVLLARHFGARFSRMYLGSVVVATLLCGVRARLVDRHDGMAGAVRRSAGGHGGVAEVEWLSATDPRAVLAWRLVAGAGAARACTSSSGSWMASAGSRPTAMPRDTTALLVRVRSRASGVRSARSDPAHLYRLNGLRRFRRTARGYGFLFGRLVWPDLAPGLHYVPPAPLRPFGSLAGPSTRALPVSASGPTWAAVANRRQLTDRASGELWHRPVTAAHRPA